MEVSGKRAEGQPLAASFTKASAEDFEFYCEPCDSEGTYVEAHGYCKNCEEYLCTICYKSHRRVRLTKNHILLDTEKMPKIQKPRKRDAECTEKCLHHPREVIIYHCKAHDVVGCHECMSGNHSDCVNDYIPDIAKGTADSAEYKAMLKEIDDIESASRKRERKANACIETADTCYSKAIKDMQMFQQDVNNQLDKMKHVLNEEASKATENAKITLNDDLDVCNIVKSSVEGMKKDMSGVPASQMFVQMKLNTKRLSECRKMLHNLERATDMQTFKFEPSADVKDKLERNAEFGKLVFTKQNEARTQDVVQTEVVSRPCYKLNVKSSTDKKDCEIVAIDMLSSQELVLADFANRTFKIVNIQDCKVTHERKLEIQPQGLTVLNKDTIAVLKNNTFVVVHKSMNFVLEKDRILFGQSCGIKNKQNNVLILFYYPFPKLDLLNQEGKILRTILSDPEKKILEYPKHIAVSKDGMYIYVSDYQSKNKITRLAMNGDVINIYKNENKKDDIKQPRGIAVAEDGSVFVCDFSGSNIRMFSADLSNQRTILTEADGIHGPLEIYFCSRENKLFISNDNCNDVLIFSLRW